MRSGTSSALGSYRPSWKAWWAGRRWICLTEKLTTVRPTYTALLKLGRSGVRSLIRTRVPNLDVLSSSKKRPLSFSNFILACTRETEISFTRSSASWPLPILNRFLNSLGLITWIMRDVFFSYSRLSRIIKSPTGFLG